MNPIIDAHERFKQALADALDPMAQQSQQKDNSRCGLALASMRVALSPSMRYDPLPSYTSLNTNFIGPHTVHFYLQCINVTLRM